MIKYLICVLFCVLFGAASLSAQSIYIPSDSPTTGFCNVTPFGGDVHAMGLRNQKYQCMATAAQLLRSNGRITALGFAPCSSSSGFIHFDSIEVVLAQTSASSLSTTFASNLSGNVKTVLKATNYDWQVIGAEWNRLGLDLGYDYDAKAHGANLVVQITVTGAYKIGAIATGFHRGNGQRVSTVGWSTSSGPGKRGIADSAALKFELGFDVGALTTHGLGCAGSAGRVASALAIGTPAPNGSILVFVSNCLAKASSLQVFGLRRLEPAIDLAVIGAIGCTMYVASDVLVPTSADLTGQYFVSLRVPNDKNLVGHSFYTQGFPLDTSANTWGRTASNYVRILIGR